MHVPFYNVVYKKHQKPITIVTDLSETHILWYKATLFINFELLLPNLEYIPHQNAIKFPVQVKTGKGKFIPMLN